MYNLLSVLSVLVIISTVPIVSAEVIRGESTVPDWVKNTASWWASEQIGGVDVNVYKLSVAWDVSTASFAA